MTRWGWRDTCDLLHFAAVLAVALAIAVLIVAAILVPVCLAVGWMLS